MFFRKKMKVTDFLEGPFLGAVLERGSFRYGDFYGDFRSMVTKAQAAPSEKGVKAAEGDLSGALVDEDSFTSSFLGAFLWLLKYRTLSTNRNSPRKLAFLDLLFDMEIPGLIKKHLSAYDTERVAQVYDLMDIRCKREYTGEIPEGEPPPFLVSPIWERKVHPPPLRVAARVFTDLVVQSPSVEEAGSPLGDAFMEEMVQRLNQMTAPVEKDSARINFSWTAPQGDAPPGG